MLRTFKYRLYPTPAQERQLQLCLDAARNWYNMCLVRYYKAAFRAFRDVHSHILQAATTDCDKAFQAFFRRVKAGEKAGYPRFKGCYHFDSFGFKEYGNGFKLDGRRLKVSGVGAFPCAGAGRLKAPLRRYASGAALQVVCLF